MKKVYKLIFTLTLYTQFGLTIAQTFNDGPVQLQVKLRDYQYTNQSLSDFTLSVGNFGLPGSLSADEVSMRVWARDNADVDGVGWGPLGGTPHNATFAAAGLSPDFNDVVYNNNFPGASVPQFFDVRIDAFENDIPDDFAPVSGLTSCGTNGSGSTFEGSQCCVNIPFAGCLFSEGDDLRCDAQPFVTSLNYRLGPPCSWYDHGYLNNPAACPGSNFYRPHIESYWRYTGGASCATAINLGTLTSGNSFSHYNSNECYSNNYPASPGNDVYYKFTVNGPIGITASLCGVSGAQFDSYLYLLNSSCTAIASNDDGCGNQSSIAYSICQAGDYYLVVDGKTAADLGTFTLTLTDNPSFVYSVSLAKTNVSCFGGSNGTIKANVTGGVAPFTYTWNPAAGNVDSLSGLAGGTYSVTVSDGNSCNVSASATITVPAQIGVIPSATPVSCGGACDGSATVTVSGGSAPYSYSWNSLPPQQLQTAVLLCANNYNVTVADAQGCTASSSTTVNNTTTVVITLDSLNDVRCNGAANGGVYLSASGGQTPYSFSWSNGVNTLDNPGLGPGSYSLTITDNTGCTAGDVYLIAEPSLLTSAVSFTFNPRCHGGNDGIVNVNVNGGVQPYSYLWNAPGNPVTQNLNNTTAGTHSVVVTDANGCTTSSSATLTQPQPYNVTVSSTGLQCFGGTNGSATVTVSGQTSPYTYFWNNFATTSTVNELNGGPFSVVIEDVNGCDTILTGTITEPASIEVQLSATEPLCADSGNGTINTTVTGGSSPYAYSWTGSGGFTSALQNPQVGSGTYSVTVTDNNSCTATAAIGVNAAQPFTLEVVAIDPACIGDSSGAVVANTTGGNTPFSYQWNASQNDESYLELIPKGTYSVTVTDANGCQVSGQAIISDPVVNGSSCTPDKYVVLVPTAFSPNGDNVNDRLIAIMKNVQKLQFRVYNRWGELVYENQNMQATDGWDGTFRNKPQPVGTYVYTFDVEYLNGVRAQEKGASTLIR
jgi:gliding motility-associated-like protein